MIEFIEFPVGSYAERTRQNIRLTDATLAFAYDFDTAGERLTKSICKALGKLYIPLDLNIFLHPNDVMPQLNTLVEGINPMHKTLKINIAGNGIYQKEMKVFGQERLDGWIYDFLRMFISPKQVPSFFSVIYPSFTVEHFYTGGQTGTDEAGAKAGDKLGIPTTVIAPKGWLFRNEEGIDIRDEILFKNRFKQLNK